VDTNQIWLTSLEELEVIISKANFTTWFKDTFIYSFNPKDESLIIGVPSSFHQQWLQDKYHQQIIGVLKKHIPSLSDLKYKVASKKTNSEKEKSIVEDQIKNESEEETDFKEKSTDNNLLLRYTFDTFIVGNSNRLAYATAQAVANNPGTKYNPLFLYGGVGLGKTHLMQAVGNEILRKNPKKKILYSSCERFTNEFIDAIQNKKIDSFKKKFRNNDVLLIDDIQFLAGKESTQEEFFHTYNALYQENRQVILTSDRPPQALSEVANRLISRFAGGMVADIKLPDLETRSAILKSKCLEKKFNLKEDTIDYIAKNNQSNIRELEGILNKIITHCDLYQMEPNHDLISKLIDENTANKNKIFTSKQIIKAITDFYSIKTDDLLGKSRQQELVFPRQILMYLLRNELKYSFPRIAKELGGKDHTTIIHGVKKISNEILKNEKTLKDIELIKEKFYTN